MSLSTLFYRMPRLTILSVLIILAAGAGALLNLGRQEDPTLVERYGFVLTYYPGADAGRVEALVTDPIETALQELMEISELTSTSRANVSQIRVEIREDLSASQVDDAWTLIRQQVSQAQASMPDGVISPQVKRQYLGAATMVVSIGWTGSGEAPLSVMNRMALDLQDRFQNYAGTEETDIFGEVTEEIRVVIDPEKLAAAGLNTRSAAALIARADAKAPAGQVRNASTNLGLEVGGEFTSVARIRSVPLLQRDDGSAVRVGDVANVIKTEQTPPGVMAFVNDNQVIMVAAYVEPNNRVDLWADGAQKIIEDFRQSAPRGIEVRTIFDQSVYTEDRLNGLS